MSFPNRTFRDHSLAVAILLSGLLLVLAGSALAQEASPETKPAQPEAEPGPIGPFEETVTVTALKSEPVTLLQTPIAITAISGKELEDRGVKSFIDFLQEAPGVSVTPIIFGSLDIQIRGLGSNVGDSLVGYYVDEAPYMRLGSTVLPDFGFFDLERVEVLRGPQGTLYGAGATGGVIRLLTRNPQLGESSVKGDIGLSSFQGGDWTRFANVAVNTPLGDKVALRLTGSINDLGGYIDYPALGRDDGNAARASLFRGKFLFEPSVSTSVVLSATRSKADADGQNTSDRGWVSNKRLAEVSEATDDFFSGVFTWVGRVSLVSSTNVIKSSFSSANDFLATPFIIEVGHDSLVQEIRLNSSNAGDWRWTGGVYYADREQQRRQDATVLLGPTAFARERDTSESLAVFGNLTRSFADGRAQASLGARYWKENKSISDLVSPDAVPASRSFDNLSPRLNVSFFPNPDNTFYLNVAEGFRSGVIQSPIQVSFASQFGIQLPPGADEETLWAYELGYKSRLAGGKVLLEAAAYLNDWQDLLVSVGVVRNVSVGFFNVGSAKTSGIEFALNVRPNDAVSFGFSGQWNDAHFSETVAVQVFDPAAGKFVPEVVVENGARINMVPQTTLDANVQVQHYFGGLRGFATLRGSYTDERVATAVGLKVFSDDVTRLDLRLGVDARYWGVHVFVDNVTNEDGITRPGFGADRGDVYRPRAVGVNLKFRS
jgi:iron complex outermembrane recepter protein